MKNKNQRTVESDKLLSYKNDRVVVRYAQDHSISLERADHIFTEMLKFLYLCMILPEPCSPPSRQIDDMWHVFILHTGDYFKFCSEFNGAYMHHEPTETPHIGNRQDMFRLASEKFGDLDPELWRHIVSGPNYCTEDCNNGGCTNRIFMNDPLFSSPVQTI